MATPVDSVLDRLVCPGSPFELECSGGSAAAYRNAPHDLLDIFQRAHRRSRSTDSPVIVMGEERVSISMLLDTAALIAMRLKPHVKGTVGKPGRVAIVLPDGPLWMSTFVAITSIGSTAVLVPLGTDVGEMASLVGIARCDLIVSTSRLAAELEALTGRPCLAELSPTTKPEVLKGGYEQLLVLQAAEGSDGRQRDADEEALIVFTSGSTASPKGVVLSHKGVVTGLWNMMLNGAWASRRNATSGEATGGRRPNIPCTLMLAPLSHVSGYSQMLLCFVGSGRLILMKEWSTSAAIDVIAAEKVNALFGAYPEWIRPLLEAYRERSMEIPLEAFSVHGAALKRGLVTEILGFVPHARIGTGYGMTETNGAISASVGREYLEAFTCGPVVPTAELQIVDEDGGPVGHGVVGNIQVRGAMLFIGYCGLSGEADPRGEWFSTGDAGYLDSNQFLHVIDRQRDHLKVGDRTIYCADVEHALAHAPWCLQCLAVATDEGQRCLVAIVADAATPPDRSGALTLLWDALQIPEDSVRILWRSDLPRTRSGKLSRSSLISEWQSEIGVKS